jgi:Ca-activated chloride channel family protein
MTLARPELLALVPLAAALLTLALVVQWKRIQRLDRVFGDHALSRLFPFAPRRFPAARLLCLVPAAIAIALGAVGVARDTPEPPPPAAPLDLAIAVDMSLSMGAADIEPSRVARARQVVTRVSEAFPEARTVLVVFADWPYTLVPPTDDPAVIRYFAQSLEANLVLDRDQGTALSAAILQAREALASRPRSGARRVILVLSDGGSHEGEAAVLSEAAAAAAADVEVWAAGLGTERGVELATETGPVLDAAGVPVVARLDEGLLMRLAAAGEGRYERVSDDRGLRALVAGLQAQANAPETDGPEPGDVTFLLALLSFPLLLLEGALDGGRGRRPRADA